MDSEVDQELAEWQSSEGCGQQSRRPLVCGIPWESIVSPVFLNLFISSLDNGIECALSKFPGGTDWGVAAAPEGCAAIQWDLDGLELGRGKLSEVQQGQVWGGMAPSTSTGWGLTY